MASVEMLWSLPTRGPVLADSEAHVWSVDLDEPSLRVGELLQVLSADEQARAGRFKFEEARRRFIVGRAVLRRILGEGLGADPRSLEFIYAVRGKPELGGAFTGRLHFNVSHSAGLALVALTQMGPIGVDVEHVRHRQFSLEIARRFFTARESAGLEALPEAERTGAFIALWTRKEAWLKATGTGIAESLGRVEMTFLPHEPARVVRVADAPDEAQQWTLIELKPATGFAGALALQARDLNVRCWRRVE